MLYIYTSSCTPCQCWSASSGCSALQATWPVGVGPPRISVLSPVGSGLTFSSCKLVCHCFKLCKYACQALCANIHPLIQAHPLIVAPRPRGPRVQWIRTLRGWALDAIHSLTGRPSVDVLWMPCGCAFPIVFDCGLGLGRPAVLLQFGARHAYHCFMKGAGQTPSSVFGKPGLETGHAA